jgi:hypothetical protein
MGVQVRNILDTDGPEPRENAARERENVWVKKAEDGVKFGGYLAGENAEKLQTVLQAGAKPHKTEDGALDPRSRGKRQADALVDALDIALGSGDLPTRGGVKPHITVTINLNDLIEAGRQATGDLTYGDGLSASAIRRLACDAGIIPVVLGSDSQPLDVGREKRYVTDGLRFALNQRDKGCVICHAPPIYCDAHHVVSWADGGVTSLANLVLMCRVDHTSLHDGHWTITIVDNQVQVTRPSWADPPSRTGRRLGQPSTTSATASAPTATNPWPPSTTTDEPPTTSGAATRAQSTADPWPSPATDPWSPSTTTDRPPITSDTATRAQPTTDPWPSPATDPWSPSTTTDGPPVTSDAATWVQPTADPWPSPATDPWSLSTTTDGQPVTSDAATWVQPTTEPPDASVGTGRGARPGWNWSYTDAIGWISPEDATIVDPWADNTAEAELCSEAEPSTTPDELSPDTPRAAGFDPWADTA